MAISSRVTTWKLRQVPGAGPKFTSARASVGSSAANVSATPALRNSRLCMVILPDSSAAGIFDYGQRTRVCRGRARELFGIETVPGEIGFHHEPRTQTGIEHKGR